jgi:TatD DNase family protein
MNWIDSHCHLDALEFEPDRLQVRNFARQNGVKSCVIPAVELANFEAVRALAQQFQDFYALGIHPLFTTHATETDLKTLRQLLLQYQDDPRLVGVGEIGLDGWVKHLNWETQTLFYKEQLKLAREVDLPVILHVRKSADALLKGLREFRVRGGIAHAFTGSLQQAEQFIELGFCLGFGGAVSFDRALKLRGLLKALPLSAIVLETDSPDIAPKWLYVQAKDRELGLSQARNDPSQLPLIAQVVAQIKGLTLEELAHLSSNNVARVLPKVSDSQGVSK